MNKHTMPPAKRDHTGKPQLDLLEFPYEVQCELVKPLEDGAKKYGYDNWQSGFDTKILLGCLKRHLAKWNSGEDIDPDSESGCMHLASVAVNAIFLMHSMLKDPERFDHRKKRDE